MELPGLLVNDQRPFVGVRQRPDTVASGRKFQSADLQIRVGRDLGGPVRAGAPDLAKRDQASHDFSSMHRGRVVIDRDFLACNGGRDVRRRARVFRLAELAEGRPGKNTNEDKDNSRAAKQENSLPFLNYHRRLSYWPP